MPRNNIPFQSYTATLRLLILLCLLLPSGGYAVQTEAADAAAEPHIRLRSATFDPLVAEPVLPAALRLVPASTEALYLVQFAAPIHTAWYTALQHAGARVAGYVPDHALLVQMDASTAAQVARFAPVRWVGAYHPAYRLAPGLATAALSSSSTRPLTVTIQTLPGSNLAAIAAHLAAWGGQVQHTAQDRFSGYLQAVLPAPRLADLAALDSVVWIEPAHPLMVQNDQAGGIIIQADALRQGLDLSGAGQVVAVADTGLDTGNLDTLHPDIRGRVVQAYALGRPDDWSDPVGHGTHIVGSVLGSGVAAGGDPPTLRYQGVAPAARLVFQSVGDAQGAISGVPFDRGTLMAQAYEDGARIHSNSWGGHTGGLGNPAEYGGYSISSRQVDVAAWELPDLLILFAAGNNGRDANGDGRVDADSILQPGSAKSVLTVGASESERREVLRVYGTAYGEPIASDRMADNASGIAALSSRGPTDDGRIKPEVVAPGTFIASLRTQAYLFDDPMEDTSRAYTQTLRQGGTTAWVRSSTVGRNNSAAWQQEVVGTFASGAATVLFTPPFSVQPVDKFDLSFWHRYRLADDDRLYVLLSGLDINDPSQTRSLALELPMRGTRDAYSQHTLDSISKGTLLQNQINPATLQIGFAILSNDARYASSWSLDDVRVDGADWGTLSQFRLAQAGDATDEAYILLGGTSTATALTAGGAALVREWLTRDQAIPDPSGALMKALLINGTVDISPGQYTTNPVPEIPATRPNPVAGWGRIDLVESLNPPEPRHIWVADVPDGLTTGEAVSYTLTIAGDGEPFRATLAWSDFPALPSAARALVNDLDLAVVTPDGSRVVGNAGLYADGQCLRDGLWDACNPVEGVLLPEAAAGTYQVQISAAEVAQGITQPFALAVSGDRVRLQSTTTPTDTQRVYLPLVRR